MTYVKLRRHAPEAQALTRCVVCGDQDAAHVTGHVLAGQPGMAAVDGGMCEACAQVIADTAETLGPSLSLDVQESQPQAGGHEITTPASERL